MLTKPSPVHRKMLLFFLAHSFQRPDGLSGNMVTVNDDGGLWKTTLGNLTEMRIHVDDDVFYLFMVLETAEIPDHICLFTVRKNVYDLSVPGISKNCLVFLPAGVAFEFIDGQHLRKFLA